MQGVCKIQAETRCQPLVRFEEHTWSFIFLIRSSWAERLWIGDELGLPNVSNGEREWTNLFPERLLTKYNERWLYKADKASVHEKPRASIHEKALLLRSDIIPWESPPYDGQICEVCDALTKLVDFRYTLNPTPAFNLFSFLFGAPLLTLQALFRMVLWGMGLWGVIPKGGEPKGTTVHNPQQLVGYWM